jgi:molybdate transport system permease protein
MNWSLGLVLRLAGLATGISVAIGLWLAFILTDRKPPFQGVSFPAQLKALLSAPVVFYYWLGASGPKGAGFWPLTEAGLVVAGVISAGPLFLGAVRSAFAALDPGYGRAARALGASEWRVFSRIHLPLAFRPILIGAASAFLGLLAELAIVWWCTGRMFL